MARRYWPGEDAIGKRFKGQDARGQNDDWLTVVGIVTDMRRSGLDKEPVPYVYEPNTQAMDGYKTADLVVGSAGSAGAWRGHSEQWFAKSIGALSFLLSSVTTLETERSDQLSPRRFQSESSSVGKTQSQSPCHDPLLDRVNLCGRGSKQLQGQAADHPQEIERAEEEEGKAVYGFGEIGENCDFTSPRKRPTR